MTEAIAKKDYNLADRLNKQIADIHLNQVLKSAEKKTQFELKKEVAVLALFTRRRQRVLLRC